MAKLRAFLKRHSLWVGLCAVIVPLLIILGLQYRSLVKLEKTSALAERAYMKNFLEDVATEVEFYYRTNAERALNISSTVFTQRHLDKIGYHFRKKNFRGAKRMFIADFAGTEDARVLFYEPEFHKLVPSCPDSKEEHAVRVACAPFELLNQKGTIIESSTLTVNDRDLHNRIILNPITDESSKVVAIVGMMVDIKYFKNFYLPKAISNSMGKFFPGHEKDSVIVTVHDGDNCLMFASQPVNGQREEASIHLPFTFADWRMAIRNRGETSEQWARKYFAINLTLSIFMTMVLIGGIVLALRMASRQMKLSQMKTDFVSNVSHELRTPLSSIRVFGEFLRLGRVKEHEKIREYGQYIETESQRLTQLINNILDFSKIESGRKTYEFEPADIGEIIAETLKTFEVRLKQNGFAIAFESAGQALPLVPVDADAIAQAFINLLDNAVKYSGASKDIRVTLAQKDRYITISVTDHGVGIPRQEQEKIFEKFHRACSPLVHDVKGSGLGLSIVKHIVDAHRGKVAVESEPGKGSTFTIHLPIERSMSDAVTPRENMSSARGTSSLGLGGEAENVS